MNDLGARTNSCLPCSAHLPLGLVGPGLARQVIARRLLSRQVLVGLVLEMNWTVAVEAVLMVVVWVLARETVLAQLVAEMELLVLLEGKQA
jgi:hypothetical protein